MADEISLCAPVECLVMGPLANNVYLIGGQQGLLVVDPSCEPRQILRAIGERPVDAILLTHDHWDHVGAAKALRDATGAPVVASTADAATISGERPIHESHGSFEPCPVDQRVEDGQVVRAAGRDWCVIATPGHTLGSLCLYTDASLAADAPCETDDARVERVPGEAVEGAVKGEGAPLLVAGDTLFRGTHGRTDFEGGDPAAMERSLARLAQLPPDTVVLPGHNDPTTIAAERSWLPFPSRS